MSETLDPRFAAARCYIPAVQSTLRSELGMERVERSGRSYYNEHDKRAAAWLRELIAEGLIAPGDVDERSIREIKAHELDGYSQCHFFAGIGGWSYALRLAGWPDNKPVWTGSCPCQPFSAAGKGKVDKDERHLWPAFRAAIAERRPAICFGEQVASADGRVWLAGVRADLEELGYGVGAADLCAAGVGAPHRRQRLFWMAYANVSGGDEWARGGKQPIRDEDRGSSVRMDDAGRNGRREGGDDDARNERLVADSTIIAGGLGNAARGGCGERGNAPLAGRGGHAERADWSRFEVLGCRDGKTRRIEAGTFPLVVARGTKPTAQQMADGFPGVLVRGGDISLPERNLPTPSLEEVQATAEGRMMRLRGYGNAIVPALAAEFIRAGLD